MAYIPPHKRHSCCTPAPESHLLPRVRTNSGGRNSSGRSTQKVTGSKIIYADTAVSKWFAIGLLNTGKEGESSSKFSTLIGIEPVSAESLPRKSGETPFALVLKGDAGDRVNAFAERPWACIVENVKNDLLLSFGRVKNEIQENVGEEVKPTLVARVGRVLFHGSPHTLDSWTESSLRKLKRSFYTNLPSSYMEHITSKIVHKVGLTFEGDKEVYHVKISDSLRPDSTISCKCAVRQDHRSIELYKIELNQVRHLIADLSCLEKTLDLRLMLNTKRIMIALKNEELDCIRALISCAVLDSGIKGGLRWPLGKDSSGDRYTIAGVWHTNAKTYRSSSFRLKVRSADRFDFRTSSGEVSGEVVLKMHGIVSQLQKLACERDEVFRMLGDNLKLIWDHFLCPASI